ncbi:NEW3 domain-containing protein [Shewanella chilikensis]|uniref:NEW3 domain-containing protein n=1 Tax=Shewanella chilikensis TaxID=558541 RepID=UPI00399C1800
MTRSVLLLLSSLLLALPVLAQSPNGVQNNSHRHAGFNATPATQLKQQAVSQSQALARGLRAKKDIALLQSLAESRQMAMLELVRSQPQAALGLILPESLRAQSPTELQTFFASEQEFQGKLEVIYEELATGDGHKLRYFLTSGETSVELFLPKAEAGLKTGIQVRVKGWQFKDAAQEPKAVVLTKPENLQVLALDETQSQNLVKGTGAVLSGTTGEQKLLVLLLNFQDNPNLQPWSIEEVRQMVFGRVNDYYLEASYGQTWLSGDVSGYLTLPIDTNCDYFGMDSYAQQAAKDAGFDLSQYSRLVYLLPKNSSCSWRGQGTVGGSPSRAWINGELNLMTIGHELGHNLGLKHAKELNCGSGYLSDSCVAITYGDTLDIMGKSEGHFNLLNKARLGWLTEERGDIVSADEAGSFQLVPYESDSQGGARGLKVRRGTDSLSGEPLWYYLEYRQPLGFDAFMAGKAVTQGVLVHLNSSDQDIESSQLLDMTPQSSLFDLDDAALVAGNSYTDSDAGVSFTTEYADANGAGVYVDYLGKACVAAAPELVLEQQTPQWVQPGTLVTYNAILTNRDSLECAASVFELSASVPAGWQFQGSSVELAPGQSQPVSFSLSSAADVAPGLYEVSVVAANQVDSGYLSEVLLGYMVDEVAAVCELAAPSWTLEQANVIAAPGETVSYQGTLTNNSNTSCEAAEYRLTAALPSGWQANSSRVTLAPGESANVGIQITSSEQSSDGVYNFSLAAVQNDAPEYQSSALASYAVKTPCSLVAPLVSVVSPDVAVAAGAAQSYQLTVSNKNSGSCQASSYRIVADVPAGWSSSSQELSLDPGESKTVSVTVISAANAEAGDYGLTFRVLDNADSLYQASTEALFSIAAPVNSAPEAVNDSVIIASKSAVSINVLGNDTDADDDALQVTSFGRSSLGTVELLANGQIRYTPGKRFKSTDSFSYTISDGKESATATVTISLSSTDSGGNSGGNKGKGKH